MLDRELHVRARKVLQELEKRGAHSADLAMLLRSDLVKTQSVLYEMLKNDEVRVRNGLWTWRERRSVKRAA